MIDANSFTDSSVEPLQPSNVSGTSTSLTLPSFTQGFFGSGFSTILLICSIILTRQPKREHEDPVIEAALDTVGFLQTMWLLGRTPEASILHRVAQVESPTIEELRKAGMFEVKMSDAMVDVGVWSANETVPLVEMSRPPRLPSLRFSRSWEIEDASLSLLLGRDEGG